MAECESNSNSNSNSICKSSVSQVSSLDNSRRLEEPWTHKGEELILAWSKQIKYSQMLHDKSGYYYKNMRKWWGLPAIIIPAVMAPISSVFSHTTWIKYVNMGAFVIVAILGGVDSFFNFATKKERHFNHSARYGELQTSIESELFKNKRFRIQADVFCTQTRMRFDMLNTTAPVIPQFLIDRHNSYVSNEQV